MTCYVLVNAAFRIANNRVSSFETIPALFYDAVSLHKK